MKRGQVKHALLQGMRSVMGEARTQRLLLARNFAAYRRVGVIFVHVPKAAGSTISQALYGRSLGHFSVAEMAGYDAAWFERLPSFAVLRHPVDRTYSAWRYVRSGGTEEGWIAPRPDYAEPDFAQFDRFVEAWLPQRLARPAELDFVFRPQSSYLTGPDGQPATARLFRLGDWDPLSDYLIATIGRGLTQTRWRNQNPGGAPESISPETRQTLADLYTADMDLFDGLSPG
ncbi:MAG: sulfotransferase family 2 domain-containing protein [Pseudomonadota bacterium]